jgi:undecaprenyl diphosphate synthase
VVCQKFENNLPKHVAIIMDGNGRWSEQKGKHRVFGHKHGVKALRRSIAFAAEQKIQALTIFAFSSENWKRPKQEVNMLMELFFTVLGSEVRKLDKNNIKLTIIGDISGFSERLQNKIQAAQLLTENNTGLVLNVAANFGGRWDITNASKKIAQQVKDGLLAIDDIDESLVSNSLSIAGLPDVDLMIRTGGDYRISNFLLWQLAYAELYFTDTLWPDFDAQAFQLALDVFSGKERRFGQTSAQVNG